MSDRATLLANVLNDPADDTARLVLADWLEEHGEEAFGQFLRASVVAGRFRGAELIDDPDYYAALEALTAVATDAAPAVWLSALGLGPSPLAFGDWSWDNAGDRVTVRIGASVGVFARGMLAELDVTLGEWYAVAAPALTAWPIERVRATDARPLVRGGAARAGLAHHRAVADAAPQRPAHQTHHPIRDGARRGPHSVFSRLGRRPVLRGP